MSESDTPRTEQSKLLAKRTYLDWGGCDDWCTVIQPCHSCQARLAVDAVASDMEVIELELSAMKAERDTEHSMRMHAEDYADMPTDKRDDLRQQLSDASHLAGALLARAEAAEARLRRAEECIGVIECRNGSEYCNDRVIHQAVANYRADDAGKGEGKP